MQWPCQSKIRLPIARCTSDLRCIKKSRRPVSQSACGISPSQLWDSIWSVRTCPRFESGDMSPHSKIAIAEESALAKTPVMNWPHGPAHWLFEPGLYMIKTGTYKKLPHLMSPERLDFFQEALFRCASEFGWDLRAWAVLCNHYPFTAAYPSDP